jgi:hypothetical protein
VQGTGRLTGDGPLGEEAGVDGQQHRGVEVVGGDLDVGQVGEGQGGVGRGRARVEGLTGGRDRLDRGVRVALEQPPPGGERVAPGGPPRLGGLPEGRLGLVEEGEERGGVLA